MDKLRTIIFETLGECKDGENFPDCLDARLKDVDVFELLWQYICEHHPKKYHKMPDAIIASGGFGLHFSNYYQTVKNNIPLFLVNGGIRSGQVVENISRYLPKKKSFFIFIDDSYYSGTTERAINKMLDDNGYSIEHTYMIYDGSKKTSLHRSALFRYYDEIGKFL